MKVEIKDRKGDIQSYNVKDSYLVKFVDGRKKYPVSYTIKQDGTVVNKPSFLLGIDLTQRQIVELFVKELL